MGVQNGPILLVTQWGQTPKYNSCVPLVASAPSGRAENLSLIKKVKKGIELWEKQLDY